MKVLSIKEPYATLIMQKAKMVETRSFKTNYRGELYIHASKANELKKNIKLEKLAPFVDLNNLNFSKIICKCQLVDCILMTEEYVQEVKNSNYQEFICGHYEVGRYAWVLSNVVPLDEPILAKGMLGIWNYNEKRKQ